MSTKKRLTSILHYVIFNLNLKKGVENMKILKLNNSKVFNSSKIVFERSGVLLCFPRTL